MSILRQIMIAKAKSPRLEYLEATGAQYIRTGVLLQPYHFVEVEVSHLADGYLLGILGNAGHYNINRCAIRFGNNAGWKFYAHYNGVNKTANDVLAPQSDPTRRKFGIGLNNGTHGIYLDDDQIGDAYTGVPETWGDTTGIDAAKFGLYLFAMGNYGAPFGNATGRMYSARVFDGRDGSLVRDFVPALDADGKPGMLDLLTDTMYYNAGSGDDFVYGEL